CEPPSCSTPSAPPLESALSRGGALRSIYESSHVLRCVTDYPAGFLFRGIRTLSYARSMRLLDEDFAGLEPRGRAIVGAGCEEERVMMERLDEKLGPRALREELRILARAYEAWLGATSRIDPPMVLRLATEALSNGSVKPPWPERLYLYSTRASESLEQAFWE